MARLSSPLQGEAVREGSVQKVKDFARRYESSRALCMDKPEDDTGRELIRLRGKRRQRFTYGRRRRG
jgi:hypothetical protein